VQYPRERQNVLCLDPEHEYVDLAENLGGCFVDLMSGQYRINPLEPKTWDDGSDGEDSDAPQTFRQTTKLSQHISFLKDFFRCYKDFDDKHIDAIELMLGKLYANWGISDRTDFSKLTPADYPILSDLYALIETEYKAFDIPEVSALHGGAAAGDPAGAPLHVPGRGEPVFQRPHQCDQLPLCGVRREGTAAGQQEREERPAVQCAVLHVG
jgi:hypothetical protein